MSKEDLSSLFLALSLIFLMLYVFVFISEKIYTLTSFMILGFMVFIFLSLACKDSKEDNEKDDQK